MSITTSANRNPNAATAGQPAVETDAAIRATKSGGQGIRGDGDAPTGPSKMPGADAGTVAGMKAGTTRAGSTRSNGSNG